MKSRHPIQPSIEMFSDGQPARWRKGNGRVWRLQEHFGSVEQAQGDRANRSQTGICWVEMRIAIVQQLDRSEMVRITNPKEAGC
jgi:hypothetical protein